MKPVGPALGRVLAAGRDAFNARVAAARHAWPGFDLEAFAAFVAGPLDSVVEAMPTERQAAAALAGYDLALQLVGRAGIAVDAVGTAWQRLALPSAHLIAPQPQAFLGALSHAAMQLAKVPGVRFDAWLDALAAMAPRCETQGQWRALGQVLAWRMGLALYRDGALRVVAQLPPGVAAEALGTGDAPLDDVLAAYRADPWWEPSGRREARREIGAFTGFGGLFSEPPELRATDTQFVVRSGERHFLLVADAFGAMLAPASADEYAAARVRGPKDAAWEPLLDDHGLPAEGLIVIAHEHAVAAASPFSHAIHFQPLPA